MPWSLFLLAGGRGDGLWAAWTATGVLGGRNLTNLHQVEGEWTTACLRLPPRVSPSSLGRGCPTVQFT